MTDRRVIAFCGYAGSGKDEAAKALPLFTRVAFADAVREAALALDPIVKSYDEVTYHLTDLVRLKGWGEAKQEPEVRRLLQRMGTEAGRDIHGQGCWVRIAARKIAAAGDVVITDMRFPNEVEFVRQLGGKIIRIVRPGVGPVNGHCSESFQIEAHIEIVNDGTVDELHEKVREAVL